MTSASSCQGLCKTDEDEDEDIPEDPAEVDYQLNELIDAGDLDGARAAAESLAPFWKRIGSEAGLLGTALPVAAGLRVYTTTICPFG